MPQIRSYPLTIRLVCSSSNVVKTRWIAEYLRNSFETARKSLEHKRPLNSENSDLYFTWMEGLSGSQQPATTVDSNNTLFESFAEKGWGEEMVPIDMDTEMESSPTVTIDTPEAILELISGKIRQYLNHHPHKADGIVLTLVTKLDAAFAARLVSRVRQETLHQFELP